MCLSTSEIKNEKQTILINREINEKCISENMNYRQLKPVKRSSFVFRPSELTPLARIRRELRNFRYGPCLLNWIAPVSSNVCNGYLVSNKTRFRYHFVRQQNNESEISR